MTEQPSHRRRNRQMAGGTSVIAAIILTLGSAAFACTQLMGTMTLSPTSGPRGSTVKATSSGLSNGATTTYSLSFNDATRTAAGLMCHESPIVLATGIVTTAGAFKTWVTVPGKPLPKGKSKVCGVDEQNGFYGTLHKTFTVL